MATVDRRILQQALQQAQGVSQRATAGTGFDPRGGIGVLGLQLATAGIGAFAQNRAKKALAEQEVAEQEAFFGANPQFAGLQGSLGAEGRQALALQLGKGEITKQFPKAASDASLGGSTGVLADRYMKATGASFPDALAAVQGLARKGLEINQEGDIAPRAGLIESEEQLRAAGTRGAKIGTAEGEAETALRTQEAKLPGLEEAVGELSTLGKKATFTKAGQARDATLRQLNLPISEGGIARAEYVAKVDNLILPLLKDTFGAAFTQKEGESLKATLGDPDKSPAEKDATLKAFIKQKRENIRSLKKEVGGAAGVSGQVGNIKWKLK